MIDELLKAGKITVEQRDEYALYSSELGRKVLDRMTIDTFMDEPATEAGAEGFVFLDGRRSMCRDIHRTIKFVKDQLRENNYV